MTTREIKRILIANRGEIALRVARACRELGIATVAIYGEGEENAAHVRYADDAWRIASSGGLPYLAIDEIVAVALKAGRTRSTPAMASWRKTRRSPGR